jgi:anti-sigma B factor antagonist
MRYSVQTKEGCVLVKLEGSLDGSGVASVEKEFNRLKTYGSGKIIVDLCDVDYISSEGVGLLVTHASHIKKTGGRFCVFSVKPQTKKLLNLAKAEQVMNICDTFEDCLN